MPSHVRAPVGLHAAYLPGRWVFATLFLIELVARASIASVIPIQAYDILQSEQKVGALYTVLGVAGLATMTALPLLARRIPRRWLYTLGALALVAASVAFLIDGLLGQAAGMYLRVFGAGALSVTLSLYILDMIGRRDLVRSKSLRLAMSTVAWTLGPWFGVWLYSRYGPEAAFGWSAAWAVLLLAVFWAFRLSDGRAISPGSTRPVTPIANIAQFIAQPRLVLAWLIAFARSCFWTTFFVWVPIMMVRAGEGELAAGLVVSLGNATLFTTLFWGRVAQRRGLREVVAGSLVGIAVASCAAGFFVASAPWVAAGLLVFASVFASALDGVGGIPFLRAVRSFERPQMTAVYRTYLESSELLPPLVFTVVLVWFDLGAVFVVLAAFVGASAGIAWRFLPRSMR